MNELLHSTRLALVVNGLIGSPATAQTKVHEDRIGDAYRHTDIRRVTVHNTAGNFALAVRLTTLRRPGTYLSAEVTHRSARSERGRWLYVALRPRGKPGVSVRRFGPGGYSTLSCAE